MVVGPAIIDDLETAARSAAKQAGVRHVDIVRASATRLAIRWNDAMGEKLARGVADAARVIAGVRVAWWDDALMVAADAVDDTGLFYPELVKARAYGRLKCL